MKRVTLLQGGDHRTLKLKGWVIFLMTDSIPTYEDIVAYAEEAGLIGKIDTVRFYEYYEKQDFMFRGAIMNWKGKMHDWAKNQYRKVIPTAKEKSAAPKEAIRVDLLAEVKRVFAMA